MSFSELVDIYNLEDISIEFKHVDGSLLRPFAESIERYKKEIQLSYDNDERLLELYNLCRRLFWKVLNSFAPYKSLVSEECLQPIFQQCYLVKNSYPSIFQRCVLPLLKEIQVLQEIDDNPLSTLVCKHINSIAKVGHRIAIVSKRAIPNKEKTILHNTLRDIFKVRYYTENSFRKSAVTYNIIVFIGNPSYFSEAVRTTFKSKNNIFISYDFFENAMSPKKVFEGLSDTQSFCTIFKEITLPKTLEKKNKLLIEQHEEVSVFINKFIVDSQTQSKIQTHELVSASIFHLENNRFIFVPKESKIRVYNPNNKKHIVEQISSKDVSEDDYIIIRNERDTSLIADVADRYILKDKAENYRTMQQRWKKKLRNNVEKKEIDNISKILINRYGIKTASVASIRNWCSDDSICPIELNKILKAFKYSPEEIQEVCRAMKEIQIAHREAGRIISNKLMGELSSDNLINLEEDGYYTFESKEFDGASFNIERVVSVEATEYFIAPHNLMKIIHIC